MLRFSSLSAATLASLILIPATAATAQSKGPFYSARPAAASTAKIVVRDTLWKCSAAGCVSPAKGNSRAAYICESLVKQVGRLEAFRAGDQEFDAEALAKCNERA